MKFIIDSADAALLGVDLYALPCFEGETSFGAAFLALDERLGGLLSQVAKEEQFQGKGGQSLQLHTHGRLGAARVLLLGMGLRRDFLATDLRAFAARALRQSDALRLTRLGLLAATDAGVDGAKVAQLYAEGALLAGYRFDKYVTGEKKPLQVSEVALSAPGASPELQGQLTVGLARGERIAQGVAHARDLVNEPAADLTPRLLAAAAEQMAREASLDIEVLGPAECRALGMGMYLAVAQGSTEEPRFIHVTYRPRGEAQKRVVLVGKGVTFDSGGLSLKPNDAMDGMKIDMAGGAAVLAVMPVLQALGCPHEVHAIVAATENMPSGSAYKLGDVLRSLLGKTVEINNTDAEGRLTLGDALAWAVRELRPDEILDFATLTGACMVALGPDTAGVMGNNDELTARFLKAAAGAGEAMWQLPLPKRLKEQLKSDVADMKNTGSRYGGALTAGLFLKEFVGDTPWVHVDLAGPASADKEHGHHVKGGTGFAVATLVEYLAPAA